MVVVESGFVVVEVVDFVVVVVLVDVRPFLRSILAVTVTTGSGYCALQKDCAGAYPSSKGTTTALIPLLQAPA